MGQKEQKNIMPKVESFNREVIPGGIYIAKLCDIEVKDSTLKRDDGSTGGKFWVWKWQAKKEKELKKAEAKIYRPETVTGNSVSQKDSKLKLLLMNCYPDKTLEEMQKFNTDEMIDGCFRIKFGTDGDGDQMKNVILSIEVIDEDDIDGDPFAEED